MYLYVLYFLPVSKYFQEVVVAAAIESLFTTNNGVHWL